MILMLLLLVLPGYVLCISPHIVWIVSDDLGFNDVSFHGSPQIPTPNIDAIANQGVVLMNYHVQPVCSPSRSTFMSGRHVIHTGIYMPFSQGTALRLNLSYTLLPEYLTRCCNYSTHMVGKWHLGLNVVASTPTGRGFETYLGYYSGAEDYRNHTTKHAYDFNDDSVENGTRPAVEYNNTYSTYIFTQRAVEIIEKFSPSSPRPLFLYLPYQNIHWPLEAPQAYIDRFKHVPLEKRRIVCGMTAILDEGVGNVTAALKRAGIFDNTLIIFSSDNGGPTHNDEGTESNNYPLRGGKNTLWEGGTRVVGAVMGAGIKKKGYLLYEKIHATDWLPTLVSMASGRSWKEFISKDEPPYLLGDGMDVWSTLSTGAPSPRDWLLLETHPEKDAKRLHGDALIVGDWKIIRWNQTNPKQENGWFPPSGQDPNSTTYTISCGPPPKANTTQCHMEFCLFNVTADPCEHNDLAHKHPSVVKDLITQLKQFQVTAVPPVKPDGCQPKVIILPNGARVWRPCDAVCDADIIDANIISENLAQI